MLTEIKIGKVYKGSKAFGAGEVFRKPVFNDNRTVGYYYSETLEKIENTLIFNSCSVDYFLANNKEITEKKKVKMLCYLSAANELRWYSEDTVTYFKRVPSEDKEIEIEANND